MLGVSIRCFLRNIPKCTQKKVDGNSQWCLIECLCNLWTFDCYEDTRKRSWSGTMSTSRFTTRRTSLSIYCITHFLTIALWTPHVIQGRLTSLWRCFYSRGSRCSWSRCRTRTTAWRCSLEKRPSRQTWAWAQSTSPFPGNWKQNTERQREMVNMISLSEENEKMQYFTLKLCSCSQTVCGVKRCKLNYCETLMLQNWSNDPEQRLIYCV